MKISVLEKTKGCVPKIIDKGEWIDLYTSEDVHLTTPYITSLKKSKDAPRAREVIFSSTLIPLGVAMKLPEGFEAIISPRSSTFKNYGIMQTNSLGVIDNSYSGDNDEWKLPVIATRETTIPKGTRLCQFRIQLSQKASLWQKLKWLFSNKITLTPASSLDSSDRGGFGSSGK